jgi:hypothetical protein
MSTTTYAAPHPTVLLRATQGLLALTGAVVLFGSVYFSLIAPTEEVNGLDWAVGAWAFALAVAFLALAPRLPHSLRLVTALVAVHAVFGVVKIVGYDETEAATFIAVDLLLLALLSALGRRQRG